MDQEKKGFWITLILLLAVSTIALTGSLIGKTLVGYLLFGLGLAAVIAIFVFVFIKKDYFSNGQLKDLIMGLILSALLASSLVLILNNQSRNSFRSADPTNSGNLNSFRANSGFSGQDQNFTYGGNTNRSLYGNTNRNSSQTSSQNSLSTNPFMMKRLVSILTGWTLLAAGIILLIIVMLRLLVKKVYFKNNRWKTLLLGILVGAMVATSTTLLITKSAYASFSPIGFSGAPANGQDFGMNPMGSGPEASVTQTATPTATPQPTNTPTPTVTPTLKVTQSMQVCIEFDFLYKTNIRNFPSDNAVVVGNIPIDGCFIVDGRNSAYPGWYHFAEGQNGVNGIFIQSGYMNSSDLWINSVHFNKTDSVLSDLPEIEVTETK